MKGEKTVSGTEIAEGLPPASPHNPRAEQPEPDIRAIEPTAMEVFFAWEKLRVIYNIIVIPCILISVAPRHTDFLFALFLCNVFFCTGVVAEGYHCWLGINRKVARWGIFVVWSFITVFWFLQVLKWMAA